MRLSMELEVRGYRTLGVTVKKFCCDSEGEETPLEGFEWDSMV